MSESGSNLSGETEARIIKAATSVFVKKGKKGTSMQDIADQAGINRTLLNYYFRSKDILFSKIFDIVLKGLIQKAAQVLNSDEEIFEKIKRFIDLYIRSLNDNPDVPVFVLNEINTNPDNLLRLIKSHVLFPLPIIKELEKAMDEGKIQRADPIQLIINLISMIVFPFAAKSMLKGILLDKEGVNFEKLMEERIPFLQDFFIKSISV